MQQREGCLGEGLRAEGLVKAVVQAQAEGQLSWEGGGHKEFSRARFPNIFYENHLPKICKPYSRLSEGEFLEGKARFQHFK